MYFLLSVICHNCHDCHGGRKGISGRENTVLPGRKLCFLSQMTRYQETRGQGFIYVLVNLSPRQLVNKLKIPLTDFHTLAPFRFLMPHTEDLSLYQFERRKLFV